MMPKNKNFLVMPQKYKLARIWEQVPPDYYQKSTNRNLLQRYWHQEKVRTLRELVGERNPKKILDVGSASGMMANEVSKIFPEAKITAVDVYKKAVDYGKSHYPHINFVVADAHSLPFPDNAFDLIICYETIEHVINPLSVIKEAKRVVKKGGRIVLAMDSGSFLFRAVWFIWEKTQGKVWQGAHLHPFRHTELEDVIKKSGLKIVKKVFSHFGMEVSFLLKK